MHFRFLPALIAFLALLTVSIGPQARADDNAPQTGHSVDAERVVTVRADPWMPYNGDPNAELPGYMVEIMRAIYEPRGYVVDYRLMPWKRALETVKAGEFNAVIGAGEDRRPNFVFPEEEIGVSGSAWFVRKDFEWTYDGLDSLRDVRLATIADYTYTPELDAYVRDNQGTELVQPMKGENAFTRNVQKLLGGRVDVIYADPYVMDWELRQLGNEGALKIASIDKPEEFERIFAGFSKVREDSAELAAIFDEGVRELRASGKLRDIMSRYGLADWKGMLHQLNPEAMTQ